MSATALYTGLMLSGRQFHYPSGKFRILVFPRLLNRTHSQRPMSGLASPAHWNICGCRCCNNLFLQRSLSLASQTNRRWTNCVYCRNRCPNWNNLNSNGKILFGYLWETDFNSDRFKDDWREIYKMPIVKEKLSSYISEHHGVNSYRDILWEEDKKRDLVLIYKKGWFLNFFPFYLLLWYNFYDGSCTNEENIYCFIFYWYMVIACC